MANQTQSAVGDQFDRQRGSVHVCAGPRRCFARWAQRVAAGVGRRGPRRSGKKPRRRWRRHNDLQPERPLIFCDPENGWNEIVTPQTSCRCSGALAGSCGDDAAQGSLLGRVHGR